MVLLPLLLDLGLHVLHLPACTYQHAHQHTCNYI